jgi:hypothetical protein
MRAGTTITGIGATLALSACGWMGGDAAPSTGSGSAATSAAAERPAPLRDGPVTPGRYVYTLTNECDDVIACPPDAEPPAPLPIEVTVPEGWDAATEFHLLTPSSSGTDAPAGAGLILGWTNFYVGLNSDPCLSEGHELPDIDVGPTVDDFVDAVQADKALDVTAPTNVELGGHPGRHFVLRGPSDISGCDNWRPWDPGFYVQGPDNQWDVYAVDVDGHRVVVVAQQFPGTPAEVGAQLDDMVESIAFRP